MIELIDYLAPFDARLIMPKPPLGYQSKYYLLFW